MDYKTAPLERIKSELLERWIFLHLCSALIPKLSSRVYTASFHQETGDWITKAPEEEIRGKAQELISKLDEIVQLANNLLLPKLDGVKLPQTIWRGAEPVIFHSAMECLMAGYLKGLIAHPLVCSKIYLITHG